MRRQFDVQIDDGIVTMNGEVVKSPAARVLVPLLAVIFGLTIAVFAIFFLLPIIGIVITFALALLCVVIFTTISAVILTALFWSLLL